MKFYFYIYGEDNGYLTISTKLHTSSEEKEVTKIVGSYGRKWIFGQTFLHFAPTETYQVRIDVTIKKMLFFLIKKQNNRSPNTYICLLRIIYFCMNPGNKKGKG